MTIQIYKGDLPDGLDLGDIVAIDTETLGLNPLRDKLCLVQLSSGDGDAHLIQMDRQGYHAPNLKNLLSDPTITKIFHFARFDMAVLFQYLDVMCSSIYCTKIASKLVRTYTDRHSLKDLCKELLGVELSKVQQSSDWASEELSEDQKFYAASDVLYLHQIKAKLDHMLAREDRLDLAKNCFDFLPTRARLDLSGWKDTDIFFHS